MIQYWIYSSHSRMVFHVDQQFCRDLTKNRINIKEPSSMFKQFWKLDDNSIKSINSSGHFWLAGKYERPINHEPPDIFWIITNSKMDFRGEYNSIPQVVWKGSNDIPRATVGCIIAKFQIPPSHSCNFYKTRNDLTTAVVKNPLNLTGNPWNSLPSLSFSP